jgi:carbamoylphosphate synthase large subunit
MTVARLLITSAGSLVGQNVLEGLAAQRRRWHVAGINTQADAVSNFLCDRVYLAPALADGAAFEARFAAILAREAPELVIPGRDDDVVFLAEWQERCGSGATRFMVGSAAAARMLRDKVLTARFAHAAGLPFAPTLCADDGFDAVCALAGRWGWPLVAKPRLGNASRGVVIVSRPEELRVAMGWPAYCFQPWLGPRPDVQALHQLLEGGVPLDWSLPDVTKNSLDGCITLTGDLMPVFSSLHRDVKLGRSERVEWLGDDAQTLALARAYGLALRDAGWRGPFNVQLGRAASGELLAFELNGRFTGSAATLRHFGADFVADAVAACLALPALPPQRTPTTGHVHKRLYNWPLPDGAVEALQSDGEWTRSG